MSFIIFDTEYTTWPGCQEHGWHGNQKKEIVQISALKVSNDLRVLDEFNVLCKPIINPVLSDYFTSLTHITNAQVKKNGIFFPLAYKKFESFIKDNICYSHAWGLDFLNKADGAIIKENLSLNNLSPTQKIVYKNIAPVFSELYKKHNIKIQNQSSGQIVKLLGIEKNIKHLNLDTHNAFYDTHSILEGLKFFRPESIQVLQRRKK